MRVFPVLLSFLLALTLTACNVREAPPVFSNDETSISEPSAEETVPPDANTGSALPESTLLPMQTGLFAEEVLSGDDGDIHYSYYLPKSYDGIQKFPMVVVMPGYDRMWFGEDSSGRNLDWSGFTAWAKLDTEIIVVSAQLTDWHEKSARQAIELTEYFIEHFAVDTSRIYAAGFIRRLSARRVSVGRQL